MINWFDLDFFTITKNLFEEHKSQFHDTRVKRTDDDDDDNDNDGNDDDNDAYDNDDDDNKWKRERVEDLLQPDLVFLGSVTGDVHTLLSPTKQHRANKTKQKKYI